MISIPSIVTPVSHLFSNDDFARRIIDKSDYLECRDRSFNFGDGRQLLFHCDFQPIHNLSDKFFLYLEKIKKIKKELKLISFHVASSCDRPKLINGMFEEGGVSYNENDMFKNAEKNFSIIKKIFGDDVEVAIENNNFYPTSAYNFVTEPEFINTIARNSNLKILFDIAHAKVTSVNKNIDYEDYKGQIDFDRVIQLHICKHGIRDDGFAFDAHDAPDQDLYDEVLSILNTSSNIKYLTIEFYKDIEILLPVLEKFNNIKNYVK